MNVKSVNTIEWQEKRLSIIKSFVSDNLKCVKITSVGLKLDRPQLLHWLLFLEHSRPRSEN